MLREKEPTTILLWIVLVAISFGAWGILELVPAQHQPADNSPQVAENTDDIDFGETELVSRSESNPDFAIRDTGLAAQKGFLSTIEKRRMPLGYVARLVHTYPPTGPPHTFFTA